MGYIYGDEDRPSTIWACSRKVNMKKFAHLGLLSLLITFCHGRFLNSLQPDGSHWRKLPCPNPEDILPCTCTADEDNAMDLDCSRVASEDELERVFLSTFPFTTFRNFTVVDNTYLKTLRNQALGIASFTGVYIMNSVLEVVEPDALSSSFATARVVNMQNNSISSFPFETLPSFTSLLELGLSDNSLTFPALESETLLVLDLSNNQIQNVAATAFSDVPEISEIYLGGNQISHIPTGKMGSYFHHYQHYYVVEDSHFFYLYYFVYNIRHDQHSQFTLWICYITSLLSPLVRINPFVSISIIFTLNSSHRLTLWKCYRTNVVDIGNLLPGTFAGHYNLHIVNLESNSLTYLPEGAIQLTSISPGTVNLRRNQITDIAVNSIIGRCFDNLITGEYCTVPSGVKTNVF